MIKSSKTYCNLLAVNSGNYIVYRLTADVPNGNIVINVLKYIIPFQLLKIYTK
jgi:hypothetical protein